MQVFNFYDKMSVTKKIFMELTQILQILSTSALVLAHIFLIAGIVLVFIVINFIKKMQNKATDTLDTVQGAVYSTFQTYNHTRKNLVMGLADVILSFTGKKRN